MGISVEICNIWIGSISPYSHIGSIYWLILLHLGALQNKLYCRNNQHLKEVHLQKIVKCFAFNVQGCWLTNCLQRRMNCSKHNNAPNNQSALMMLIVLLFKTSNIVHYNIFNNKVMNRNYSNYDYSLRDNISLISKTFTPHQKYNDVYICYTWKF